MFSFTDIMSFAMVLLSLMAYIAATKKRGK